MSLFFLYKTKISVYTHSTTVACMQYNTITLSFHHLFNMETQFTIGMPIGVLKHALKCYCFCKFYHFRCTVFFLLLHFRELRESKLTIRKHIAAETPFDNTRL